jgi:hypothetical protein
MAKNEDPSKYRCTQNKEPDALTDGLTDRPKRGRPPMKPEEKRQHRIVLKLTDNEKIRVNERAKEGGMFPSDVLRLGLEIMILNSWDHSVIFNLSDEQFVRLRRVGNNIGVNNLQTLGMYAMEDYIDTQERKIRDRQKPTDGANPEALASA